MKSKHTFFSLAGGLVLLLFPFQSLAFCKFGKRQAMKDCATNAVAPGHAGSGDAGCCMAEAAECSCVAEGDGNCWSMILEANAIYLTVNVPEISLDCPEDAVLTVNGDPTATKGASRRFIVRNLQPGKEYEFKIAAITKNRAGVELMQKETVKLEVGQMHTISLKPVRRKADIEKLEAEQAAKAAEESEEEYFEEESEGGPENVDAAEPVAMAFPFSIE